MNILYIRKNSGFVALLSKKYSFWSCFQILEDCEFILFSEVYSIQLTVINIIKTGLVTYIRSVIFIEHSHFPPPIKLATMTLWNLSNRTFMGPTFCVWNRQVFCLE
jgi:hypothetical protein